MLPSFRLTITIGDAYGLVLGRITFRLNSSRICSLTSWYWAGGSLRNGSFTGSSSVVTILCVTVSVNPRPSSVAEKTSWYLRRSSVAWLFCSSVRLLCDRSGIHLSSCRFFSPSICCSVSTQWAASVVLPPKLAVTTTSSTVVLWNCTDPSCMASTAQQVPSNVLGFIQISSWPTLITCT